MARFIEVAISCRVTFDKQKSMIQYKKLNGDEDNGREKKIGPVNNVKFIRK